MLKQTHIALFLIGTICSGLNAQKSRFVARDVGTAIKVLNRKDQSSQSVPVYNTNVLLPGYNFNTSYVSVTNIVPTDTFFIGIDSGYYKVNHEETLILLEHPNFKSKTEVVQLRDLRKGNKRMVLKKFEFLPKKQADDVTIKIKKVALKVKQKSFSQNYYEEYSDFLAGRIEHTYASDREIMIPNTIFDDMVNDFLAKKTGHYDTTGKLVLSLYDNIELDLIVNSITEHKFNEFCVVELSTTVKFPGFFTKKEKTYITKSNVGFDGSNENQSGNIELISDALGNVIVDILKDFEVRHYFKKPQIEGKRKIDSSLFISLTSKLAELPNLENATNAVVTVTQKNGHGSGCIISNDGYIVTNFHVTGDDTSDIHLIFNSGSKKRARFVRGNATYDLALLKVDTTIATPLKINDSKIFRIGSDVYAIGTPRDISLGQTITKGIISAKRIIDEKVFIQSDASVNSGNSGGALTNKEGELIGIVNSKLVGYGVEGVSFAIPSYYIEEFLQLKINK